MEAADSVFFFQAEDGIRDKLVTGVQTCALPIWIEADIYDLIVEGEIPREIEGRWYRATPDHQYPPSYAEDTYISGDGMISMFRIEDGHVDYKSRYVMTERLKNDRKARRSLYGRYRNPYTAAPSAPHHP